MVDSFFCLNFILDQDIGFSKHYKLNKPIPKDGLHLLSARTTSLHGPLRGPDAQKTIDGYLVV